MSLYIYFGLPVVLVVLLTVVARIEKRMVWPYGPPENQPRFGDASGFGARRVGEAMNAGFRFLGWCPDIKGQQYRMSYAFLVSPEQDCFVIVAIGTIMNMKVSGFSVYTRATDGTVIYTTDNQNGVEFDVSRRWRSQLVPNSTFPVLLRHHRELLRARGIAVQPFAKGCEIEDFKAVREDRFRAMADKGLITFERGLTNQCRYTTRGALKWAALNYTVGMMRALTFCSFPKVA